jgi:hypothetical protein
MSGKYCVNSKFYFVISEEKFMKIEVDLFQEEEAHVACFSKLQIRMKMSDP